jgi:hypothetical protein
MQNNYTSEGVVHHHVCDLNMECCFQHKKITCSVLVQLIYVKWLTLAILSLFMLTVIQICKLQKGAKDGSNK